MTSDRLWTAPDVERIEPPSVADERTALELALDYQRATLLTKCAGSTGEQLAARVVPPSSLSLLGLLRHLAGVERWWFRQWFGGEQVDMLFYSDDDPEQDFDGVDPARAEDDYATYVEEVERTRPVVAGRPLEQTFHRPRGELADLRWLYLHLIEEYARHNGHADLIRERLDGRTGE